MSTPDDTVELVERAAQRCGTDVPSLRRRRYGRAGVPPAIARARRLAAHALVHHAGLTRRAAAQRIGINSGTVWQGVRDIDRQLLVGDPQTHADVRHVCGLPPLPERTKRAAPTRMKLPVVEPRTACPPKVRECRHAWCRYNLGPEGSTSEMCSLEVAQDGPLTLESIAQLFGGMSRERVRQIEVVALAKYKAACERYGIEPELGARQITHWERAELEAPGPIRLELRGNPEHWRR